MRFYGASDDAEPRKSGDAAPGSRREARRPNRPKIIKKNTQAAQEASFRKQLTTESKQGNRSKNAKKRSRSAVRNKFADQIYIDTPLSEKPTVAVIGGGPAGLACATHLRKRGVQATVFDTGKHGVGGRMATRHLGKNKELLFDHACQFFTAQKPSFQAMVDGWLEEGAVALWDGPVSKLNGNTKQLELLPSQAGPAREVRYEAEPAGKCSVEAGPLGEHGRIRSADTFSYFSSMAVGSRVVYQPARPVAFGVGTFQERYVAVGGMRQLCEHMARTIRMTSSTPVEPCWVSRMSRERGKWALWENRESLGDFDLVVIAHNGKCANRLLNPSSSPNCARQMQRMKLSSIWALMVAFETPLPVDFEGAFVEGIEALSWAGNNTPPG
ncbi:hypothetical protein CYMTET_14272 [Cymbomonas tetramitiformis]|uniref:Uncharacterized protein n=1 Tax=Cymbomonas tetramitiformis TaxID=36881 RepID=A0AAE0GGQ0_9CHLO|nr:hypothetical protein CYMTET_14272 [Cymbomonas tetramitiformis]